MKKLGIVTNIRYEDYINHLKSIENRTETYWNPKCSIWGEEFCLYTLTNTKHLDQKEDDDLLRKSFHSSLLSDNLNSYSIEKLKNKIELFFETNTPIPYVYRNNYITVINLSGDLEAILNEFIEIKELTNFNGLTFSKILELSNNGSTEISSQLPSNMKDKSINDISLELESKKKELEELKEKNYQEIERLRDEQQKQLDALRDELNLKEQELIIKKDKLLDDIFMIEDKIFDLRIIFQEAFNIVQVKKGKRCDIDRPIVIYQKFRYLEDEIVRLATLRAEDFSGNHKQVEKLVEKCPTLLETLCPSEKCVTVCRMTENDKYYVKDIARDICEAIETLHGKQLCLIIRDGENIDIVWIDEDIVLKDNLFLTENTQLNEQEVITENTKLRSKTIKIALNRKYLMLILQTCINNNIIRLPEKVSILENTPHIIFTDADKLLNIDKYPYLSEYVRECNKYENCKVGDDIIIVQRASGSNWSYSGYSRQYSHYRGNGYEDRAHDAYINTGLNKINLMLPSQDKWYDDEIFVSCEKTYSDKGARANVKIYRDEFINLTFVSSNHIKYWIDSKKIGGFSALNYAQVCTFLKDALELVNKREYHEFDLINSKIKFEYNSNNIDILTEWKFNNKVRKIHKMNVSKFIKSIKGEIDNER